LVLLLSHFLVKEYWSIADAGMQDYEVPLSNVTKLLVSKHIASDIEAAKKIGTLMLIIV